MPAETTAPMETPGRGTSASALRAREVLADVAHEPGAKKPDPIVVADHDHPQLRRPDRGRRGARGGPARRDHRADRAERRRQDHLLQPAHRVRPPRQRRLVVQRHEPEQGPGVQGRPDGHGPHLPADQGALEAHGHREHAGRRDRPEGRDAPRRHVQADVAPPGDRQHQARRLPARAVPADQEARGLRRGALRRPAQAPRDGPRADGRPGAGDARRADGRGEPRAQAVAARSREVAAGRRPHRALRRARHGHGARHLRLGHRDGPGQDHRRGAPRVRDGRPARDRRLPRRAPRRGAHLRGGGEDPRRGVLRVPGRPRSVRCTPRVNGDHGAHRFHRGHQRARGGREPASTRTDDHEDGPR